MEAKVEEAKVVKSFEELSKEYETLCAQAGSLQYSILCNESHLKKINGEINAVNLQIIELKKSDSEVSREG